MTLILNLEQKDINRFWSKVPVKPEIECWVWSGGKHKSGYGTFWLGNTFELAHRVSYVVHGGKLTDLAQCVLHNCPDGDNRLCVNPNHLWVGTKTENTKDRDLKGRWRQGKGNTKLSDSELIEIRRLYNETSITRKELAILFKCSTCHIWNITTGKLRNNINSSKG